mmetsp:Transcript_4023/g.9941  ORF Transcript_4023/g.9941 Transcript_4023/m.9941 type:complete len:229 (-) Transcript_4023:103-789(-)
MALAHRVIRAPRLGAQRQRRVVLIDRGRRRRRRRPRRRRRRRGNACRCRGRRGLNDHFFDLGLLRGLCAVRVRLRRRLVAVRRLRLELDLGLGLGLGGFRRGFGGRRAGGVCGRERPLSLFLARELGGGVDDRGLRAEEVVLETPVEVVRHGAELALRRVEEAAILPHQADVVDRLLGVQVLSNRKVGFDGAQIHRVLDDVGVLRDPQRDRVHRGDEGVRRRQLHDRR